MNNNPPSKNIDIKTQEGLGSLKIKAKWYGHYAEQLKVMELIQEIEQLKISTQADHYAENRKILELTSEIERLNEELRTALKW